MIREYGLVRQYERKGIFSIEMVSENIPLGVALFGEDTVKTSSDRYKLFADNPCCVSCGFRGTYYAKERMTKRYPDGSWRPTSEGFHFNLYGTREDGSEVMMTKDHIVPKSKGGQNHISNYQTMCAPCNGEKGNKIV